MLKWKVAVYIANIFSYVVLLAYVKHIFSDFILRLSKRWLVMLPIVLSRNQGH